MLKIAIGSILPDGSEVRSGVVSSLPRTRRLARLLGLARYFTGKPCRNGHVSDRSTINGRCSACKRAQGQLQNWSRLGVDFDLADYRLMLTLQFNSCAICGSEHPGNGFQNFAVDHNHETGKVRGLLCFNCNRGLGLLGDKPDVLREAARYVEMHQ